MHSIQKQTDLVGRIWLTMEFSIGMGRSGRSLLTINPGGGTPIHYLYGYVPLNGVMILKLLIQNGVSISEVVYLCQINSRSNFLRQYFPLIFFLPDHGKDLCVKIAKLITRDNLFPLSFFLFRFFFFALKVLY